MRRLFSLAVALLIGLIAYNYFFGDTEEKENVKKIVGGVKELLRSTKQNYEAGEYDDAIQKISDTFKKLKEKVGELDEEELDQISELEQRKENLEQMLDDLKEKENSPSIAPTDSKRSEAEIKRELKELIDDTDRFVKEVEQN